MTVANKILLALLLMSFGAPGAPRSRILGETILGDAMTRLSSSRDHTCQLFADGTLRCWGRNNHGQLGDGTTSPRSQPVQVAGLFTGKAMAVAAGREYTCALAGSNVQCWGNNLQGQVGDGTLASPKLTPVFVSDLGDAVAVAAGGFHACALVAGGQVRCWGLNSEGQLGNGSSGGNRSSAVTVANITDAVAIAAGARHTCALSASGQVRCWGEGGDGQLGRGSLQNSAFPVFVTGLTNAVAIAAKENFTCALLANGTARCWGDNERGQLGDGTTTSRSSPVAVASSVVASDPSHPSKLIAIATGELHACALKAAGTVICWGQNSDGQIGDGTIAQQKLAPTVASSITTGTAIAAGRAHSCAVQPDGLGRCWGDNGFSQLGNGTQTDSSVPTTVSGAAPTISANAIAAGGSHTCAIRANGNVACWGSNAEGQLGLGSSGNSFNMPTGLPNTFNNVKAVTAGGRHTCAIQLTGASANPSRADTLCWGAGSSGQLGNGGDLQRNVPFLTHTVGASTITPDTISIAAGDVHTCAIFADGSVGCWGSGSNGQNGRFSTLYNPVAVEGLNNVIAVATGDAHTCALTADGRVSCWGRGSEGQLGTGSLNDSSSPTVISALSNVVAIATGANHTCALIVDGTARCWGSNVEGQIGDGTRGANNNRNVPTAVSGLNGAIGISAGANHTCAMTPGVVRCWGDNLSGQLGNDTRNDSSLPVNVIRAFFQGSPVPLKGMMQVATGGQHTCALENNGGVRCWGRNDIDGQVGDGSNLDRLLAVSVPSFTLNINPVVLFGKKEKFATVTIIATCEEGQRLHGEVDVRQGFATGRGVLHGECTGALTSYPVKIRAHGKNDFVAGEALVEASATIRDHGEIVDSQRWSRRVTITGAP